ncbi:MAG: HAD family hydrolase [Dehalococcoidia bacterium]
MDSTKIKLISFDLWETLISDNYKINSTQKRNELRTKKLKLLFKKYNYEIRQIKINDSINWISKRCTQDHNMGIDRPVELRIDELFTYLNIDLENDKFKKEVLNELDESFLSSPPQLFKNAKKVLRLLKNNYLICLTSNTGITSPKTYRKYLNNLGIIDIFDKVYLSNELLVAKPSSLVFKKITNDFKFKADQIVHVGDNIFTDIFGAKKIGIKTVHINKRKSVHNNLNFTPDYTVKDISELLNLIT